MTTDLLASTGPVLVVIPTLNEVRHLATVVTTLTQDLPPDRSVSVVIADGGSTDGTVELARQLEATDSRVHYLHNPQRLQSAAVNLAVQRFGAEAEVLIRCDAHCGYPKRFVAALLESLERSGADAVVVPMDSTGETCFQRAVAWASNTWAGTGGSAHRAGRQSAFVDHGHHAAFRMASFRRAGGYDSSFSHNEDAELDCRQRLLGSRIYLDADIRLRYHPRSSLTGLARQYFAYGRGRSRTAQRHPRSLRARQLALPVHLILCLVVFTLAPWWSWGLLWPAAYITVLAFISVSIAAQQRSPCGLLAGIAAIVMHSSWAAGFLMGRLGWGVPQRELQLLGTPDPSSLGALSKPDAPTMPNRPNEHSEPHTLDGKLRAVLVDPSLFTAPYDAALTEGLLLAQVDPLWVTRPTRRGDRQELPLARTAPFFYRRTDEATWLPTRLKPLAKGLAHFGGLCTLMWRTYTQPPDVLHFQWIVVPVLDTLAMGLLRRMCPLVLTVHDTIPFNGQKLSWLQRLGHDGPMQHAHRVIVHTRAGRAALLERGVPGSKLAVVPHGPLQLATVAPTRSSPRDSRYTFVLFGEIKPYKGLDVLIEAMAMIPPALRQQTRVIVAGRPRMSITGLVDQIAQLGLEGQFDLRPERQTEVQMATLFDDADCFVFPYRQIDASGVYFLVAGLGKWMIASQVGIFAEDLASGIDGTLVPPQDPHALAQALQQAIADRPAGRHKAVGDSWAEIGRATRQLYQEAIAEFDSLQATPQPRVRG